MVVAKKYIYIKSYDGMPSSDNFQIVEEELSELKDGEFLLETIYLSVDPYMRAHAANFKIGETMRGTQVGRILQSKSAKFPVNKHVVVNYGWRTHSVIHEDYKSPQGWGHPTVIKFNNELPLSYALGILGMPGNVAYFGLMEICKPKSGETICISSAAGAIGSIVGQIAKIKGCTVIGIAGSDKKNEWLKSMGFDHVINYKTEDIAKNLQEIAPQRIDCYFDNVGGEISSIVLQHMNTFGRIACCGSIVHYNDKEFPKATIVQRAMINNLLEMRGLRTFQFINRWDEGISQNSKWIQEGKLKYKETIIQGFDKMVEALVSVLKGDGTGKTVVKL